MGNKLFGVDIAGIIHKNISPGVLPVLILKKTQGARDSNNPTAGRPLTPAQFKARGFWENFKPSDIDGTNILLNDRKALLIGDSIPAGGLPQKQDEITIAGHTLVVHALIEGDPADATFVFHCRDRKGPDGQ